MKNEIKNIIIRLYLVIKWGFFIFLLIGLSVDSYDEVDLMRNLIFLPMIYLPLCFLTEKIIIYIIYGTYEN